MSLIPSEIEQVINQETFDQILRTRILDWAKSCSFSSFLEEYKRKIAAKLKGAKTEEDQRDLGLELYIGYIFSETGCSVEFEPKKFGPDFKITVCNEELYCEVRRIRETDLNDSSDDVFSRLDEDVIPRNNIFEILIGYNPDGDSSTFHDRAKQNYSELVNLLQALASCHFTRDTELRLPRHILPYATLFIRVPQGDDSVGWASLPSFTFRAGNEYRKFGTIICEKLKQLAADSTNIVYMRANNLAHEFDDFTLAIENLFELKNTDPEVFLSVTDFCSISKFEENWKRCSGVVVKTGENRVPIIWQNPDANKPLSDTQLRNIEDAIRKPFRIDED